MPGGKSRWSQGEDLSWEPLRPELVVEVAYEHVQSGRFRHMAHFRRRRTDPKPATCTFAKLEVVPPEELKSIFAGGEYRGVSSSASQMDPDESVQVHVKVKNTGKRASDELVQKYVQHLGSVVTRPQIELKGYKRVRIRR